MMSGENLNNNQGDEGGDSFGFSKLAEVDERINREIAEDTGTDEIIITPTKPEEVGEPKDDFAEVVDIEQGKKDGNDYSQNLGIEDDEYRTVEADPEAQAKADLEYLKYLEEHFDNEAAKTAYDNTMESLDDDNLSEREKDEIAKNKAFSAGLRLSDEEFENVMKDLGIE